ncbi:AAA family ATPase [Candidatus Aerophobetes bacterium]|uniref:ADP,ATP carrier protein n=1 Tax=Aerophobetes bacterium TaxID=2030807 RepID=A0A2A4X1Z9_UNCAE|nr:MAG: AAA family ATPase [Candidatus Aerophobetes bacterium]
MSLTTENFGKLRSFFFPIHRTEIKKFLPLFFIYALICFSYSLLKIAKDALICTAPHSAGAATIPFIKIWGVLPMALLVMYIFTKLFNRFSQEKVLYIMMSIFLLFFALFTFVLFPYQDFIHPTATADYLQTVLPSGFDGLISMFRNWTFTLFYIMSELWGTAIMSVLFWGFANEITTAKDAKRFYGLLGVGANVTTIFSGQIALLTSGKLMTLSPFFGVDPWEQSLRLTTSLVIVAGLITLALFRWYFKNVLKDNPQAGQKPSKKEKMGIRQSFRLLSQSKYIFCIAILVLGFNVAMNLVEVIWKGQISILYPNPSDYSAYMGKVFIAIGIVSTLISLFLCSNLIRNIGWTNSAFVTPVAILLTGGCFFAAIFFKDSVFIISLAAFVNLTPLALALTLGTLQNVLSRSCKYTLFDATKEIAFIPLSRKDKITGKAAIDGVGSRIGKSGGAAIYQSLFFIFGSAAITTSIVGVILFLIVMGWMVAVKSLGKQFHTLTQTKPQADQPPPATEEKTPATPEPVSI